MKALAVNVTRLGKYTQQDVENESGTKIRGNERETHSQQASRYYQIEKILSKCRTFKVRILTLFFRGKNRSLIASRNIKRVADETI